MSYVAVGAPQQDPFALFESRLNELREGKVAESKGERPPTPLSKLDWWCWDTPNFKQCHAMAFRAAQADCEVMGQKDVGACIVPLADHYAQKACPCDKPPVGKFLMGSPWLVAGLVLAGAYVIFMPAKKKKEGA